MALPVVITASEESLKAVPKGFREGSLALGATKWQTIRTNVLPYALPGMLTSSILGIARVAGETAPIMFTAAYVMRDKLPWEGGTSWRLPLPGRDGAALSHLRRQLENSAERIHRTRAVRHGVRLFARRRQRIALTRLCCAFANEKSLPLVTPHDALLMSPAMADPK